MANKNTGRDLHGLLVLDKPLGLSSNHALQRVKRLFNAKKVGHTGTLDPLATGVLVLCFGRATKIVDHIMDARKSYYVVAQLGQQTDTADKEGEVIASSEVTEQHIGKLASTLKGFVGEIEQIPPMYSALKKDGVPLYKLARAGKQVDRHPRQVCIDSIELNMLDSENFSMTVACSKGTYIRTLVDDIGLQLGCHAHVTTLRRLSVGCFGKDVPMHSMQQLEAQAEDSRASLQRMLLPIESAFLDYPRHEMKNGLLAALEQGVRVKYPADISSKNIRIYDTNGVFRGLGTMNPQGFIQFNRQI